MSVASAHSENLSLSFLTWQDFVRVMLELIKCVPCFLARCSSLKMPGGLVVYSAAQHSQEHLTLFTQQRSTSCSSGGADPTFSLLKCHSLRGAPTHSVTGQDVHLLLLLRERGKHRERRDREAWQENQPEEERDNTPC